MKKRSLQQYLLTPAGCRQLTHQSSTAQRCLSDGLFSDIQSSHAGRWMGGQDAGGAYHGHLYQ